MRRFFEITLLLSMLFFCPNLFSQTIHYVVYKTSNVPVIDGHMDDFWKLVPVIDKFYSIKEKSYEISPDNEMDASPKFKVVWDDKYLYFYAETYDDTLHKDRLGWDFPTRRGYTDDCFEIFLDGDNSRGTKYDGKTEGEIWFIIDETEIIYYNDFQRGFSIENIVWAQYIWKDEKGHQYGWSIEVAIPLVNIFLKPAKGVLFGMDLKYSDDDGHELNSSSSTPGTDREHNLRWAQKYDAHAPSNFNTAAISEVLIQDTKTGLNNNQNGNIPNSFQLWQNYPNPFNPNTTISYSLQKSAEAKLTVYNTLGQQVKILVNENVAAGTHTVQWDGTNAAGIQVGSGVYCYKLESENQSKISKMLIIK